MFALAAISLLLTEDICLLPFSCLRYVCNYCMQLRGGIHIRVDMIILQDDSIKFVGFVLCYTDG